MKVIDIIFALIFGRILGFLLGDFLRTWDIHIGFWWAVLIWLIFPLVTLLGLWLAGLLGRKFLFVFQGAKFFLVGAAATVADLKLFELLFLILPFTVWAKSISFIVATCLKYWGNKYWAFGKHEKNGHQEFFQFFLVTLVGLAIDVLSFYWAAKVIGPQFGFPGDIWIKLSVIFAALTAALWNFCGYKFFVFRK